MEVYNMPTSNVKKGKSREVKIFESTVIKIPIKKDYSNELLPELVIMAKDGELENIKEILIYKYIKSLNLRNIRYADIINYNLDNYEFEAEKLEEVDEEKFYKNFYNNFYFLRYYIKDKFDPYNIFDNHTLENHENYGIDNKGNLKILDYAPNRIYIQDLDFSEIDFDTINKVKQEIKDDIKKDNYHKLVEYKNSIEFLNIILASYKENIILVLIKLWIKKILSLKDIYDFIKKKHL